MEKYKLGMVCGRFSHIHKGHQLIIEKSLEDCEKTIILVGSAQEEGTLRNPFSADFRINLIKKIYDNPNIKIQKLNDMTNEYDITDKWGRYVIDKTIEYEGRFADAIISGNDESRKDWFSKEQIKNVKEILVDRNHFRISATTLRGYLLINNKEEWSKYVPNPIIEDFDKIRDKLLTVPIYQKILEEMKDNISIENYEKIYKKYENEDKKMKIKNI